MEIRRSIVLYVVIVLAVTVAFFAGLELGRESLVTPERASDGGRSLQRQSVPFPSGQVFPADEVEPGTLVERSRPGGGAADSEAPAPKVEITGGGLAVSGTRPAPSASRSSPPSAVREVTLPSGEPEPEPAAAKLPYTIQVAAHSSEKEAQATLTRLEAKNFTGRIRAPRPGDPDQFYRVWVGHFASPEAARVLEKQLKAAGFATFVRRID